MEERQRGVADSLVDRSQTPARLRNLKAHRATLRRRGALLCGFALPFALSPGDPWLDSGPVGGKERAAPPTLLPIDSAGTKGSGLAATRLANFRRGHQPYHGS